MRSELARVARLVGRSLVGGFVVWLLTWHCVLAAGWWTLVAWPRRWRARQVVAMVAVGLLLVPWSAWRYAGRVSVLTERVVRDGPEALGVGDRVAILGLDLVMAGVGAGLGFPEVAAETAALVWPGPAERTWDSGRFPACVPAVARVVERARATGRRVETDLAWTYGAPGTSWRGALALNPAHVVAVPQADEVALAVRVPVDYPPRAMLPLFDLFGRTVGVEEGLFHALEELGWLHPYRLTWTARIGEPVAPCEAWSVRLLTQVR
jgi:hypothetical protein